MLAAAADNNMVIERDADKFASLAESLSLGYVFF